MPEMHLKQSGFNCSACGPFTKNNERIQKFKETGYTSYIYKNELDKPRSQHDMFYGDLKHLILLKTLNLMVIKDDNNIFDKKTKGSGVSNN